MKYQPGQTVILLDTVFKPVTNAVIKELNMETKQYFVEYKLPNNSPSETIWVPQERLSTALDIISSAQ